MPLAVSLFQPDFSENEIKFCLCKYQINNKFKFIFLNVKFISVSFYNQVQCRQLYKLQMGKQLSRWGAGFWGSLQWVTIVVGHRKRWDRVGYIAMDRANAVMTRHREVEDFLDWRQPSREEAGPYWINDSVPVTNVSLQVVDHRLERYGLRPVNLHQKNTLTINEWFSGFRHIYEEGTGQKFTSVRYYDHTQSCGWGAAAATYYC